MEKRGREKILVVQITGRLVGVDLSAPYPHPSIASMMKTYRETLAPDPVISFNIGTSDLPVAMGFLEISQSASASRRRRLPSYHFIGGEMPSISSSWRLPYRSVYRYFCECFVNLYEKNPEDKSHGIRGFSTSAYDLIGYQGEDEHPAALKISMIIPPLKGPKANPMVATIAGNTYVLHISPINHREHDIPEPTFEILLEEDGAFRWESLPPPLWYSPSSGSNSSLLAHCIIGRKIIVMSSHDFTTCAFDCDLGEWQEPLVYNYHDLYSLPNGRHGFPDNGQCIDDDVVSTLSEKGYHSVVFFSNDEYLISVYLIDEKDRIICCQDIQGLFPHFLEEDIGEEYFGLIPSFGKVINLGNGRMCAVMLGGDVLSNCIMYVAIFRLSELNAGSVPLRNEAFRPIYAELPFDDEDDPMKQDFLAVDIEMQRVYNLKSMDPNETILFGACFL